MFKLHGEQGYVSEIGKSRGIEARLVHHTVATDTCDEKALLLGWPPERVVKALFFHNGLEYVCIVTPELHDRTDTKKIISEALLIPRSKAGDYRKNGCPRFMSYGTCTPFPLESSMSGEIRAIILREHSPIDTALVDISVGGAGDEAHRTSMHIPYGGIYAILNQKFPGQIYKQAF